MKIIDEDLCTIAWLIEVQNPMQVSDEQGVAHIDVKITAI